MKLREPKYAHVHSLTVSLRKNKLFNSGSCPILVLTTFLGTDPKNCVKNYQGPTASRENVIRNSLPYNPNPSYFCVWNFCFRESSSISFILGNKVPRNTCGDIENKILELNKSHNDTIDLVSMIRSHSSH